MNKSQIAVWSLALTAGAFALGCGSQEQAPTPPPIAPPAAVAPPAPAAPAAEAPAPAAMPEAPAAPPVADAVTSPAM